MSAAFIATAVLRASLLLALGLAALRWLPVDRPQLRRLAALVCLGASLVLPILPSPAMAPVLSGHLASAALSEMDINTGARVLVLVWSIGAMLAVFRLVFRGLALRRWIAGCERLPVTSLFSMNLPVLLCRKASAPCVAGLLRPVLIVPEKARQWDDDTWRCVLTHELQHVRQGDLWLGWITHAVRVLHWWNPLAWKLSRSAGLECEACCDDAVLKRGVKAVDYARVLLCFTHAESAQPSVGFSIRGAEPSSLRLRMERFLAAASPQSSAWRVVAVAVLLLTGMAGCLWFAVEKPTAQDNGLSQDAAVRWQANPFPADER